MIHPSPTPTTKTLAAVALGLCLTNASCRRSEAGNQPSPAASASSAAASSAPLPPSQVYPNRFPVPTGPILPILAGQGLGPIRFGATRATIERHMQAPCDVATETLCRYIPQAAEFTLDNGVVSAIRVHRIGRPTKDKAGKDVTYGAFNGGIPPDLRMGMLPWAIEEKLGKAKRVEHNKVAEYSTEEEHYYDGLIVEYDRMPNGKLVMGGVQVVKTNATVGPH